jgi:hypothetical protein
MWDITRYQGNTQGVIGASEVGNKSVVGLALGCVC